MLEDPDLELIEPGAFHVLVYTTASTDQIDRLIDLLTTYRELMTDPCIEIERRIRPALPH